MPYKNVDITESDTGSALFSEALSIPLLRRGTSDTRLLDRPAPSKSFGFPTLIGSGRPTTEALGLPLLVKSDKGRAKLWDGSIFGRFFKEIIK